MPMEERMQCHSYNSPPLVDITEVLSTRPTIHQTSSRLKGDCLFDTLTSMLLTISEVMMHLRRWPTTHWQPRLIWFPFICTYNFVSCSCGADSVCL